METKEVLNITPDDWAISDSARGLDINGGLKTAGQPTGLSKVCIMNKGGLSTVNGNPKHNAFAIVTAVNNTYKKGIDPSAVSEMLEALKVIIRWGKLKDGKFTFETSEADLKELKTLISKASITI